MLVLEREADGDAEEIEALLDWVFGPQRRLKGSYRFRDHVPPVPGLGFVMRHHARLIGSIRFWPARLSTPDGAAGALILGPLVVAPAFHGAGVGTALLRRGLAAATGRSAEPIFLVGDASYYRRVGFDPVLPARCAFPGEVDPARLLVHAPDGPPALPRSFALEPVQEEVAAV